MLPIEMALSFLIEAIIEDANSGILVPTDTTVMATTRLLTPKLSAKLTAPFTNNSEPNQSPKPPIKRYTKTLDTIIFLLTPYCFEVHLLAQSWY